MRMTRGDTDRPSYEPPELVVLGTLHELTLLDFCVPIINKTFGKSDFWSQIPAANCSS
jgi:hypothetical protein